MSNEQDQSADPENLFGPPPLLRGENKALYSALHAEVERMIEPTTILERADVRDITDKIWEAQRCKRFEAAIIESACVSALAHILMPTFNLDSRKAFEAANMYYDGNPQQRKLAAQRMADYNITDEMIHAKALAQQSSHIAYIDRMITSREVTRNRLFSDIARRREASPKPNRSSVHSVSLPAPSDQEKIAFS